MYPSSNARLTLPRELEPALNSVQEAAKETADNWGHTYRKPGRPVINLNAVKLDEHTETRTRGPRLTGLALLSMKGSESLLRHLPEAGRTRRPFNSRAESYPAEEL